MRLLPATLLLAAIAAAPARASVTYTLADPVCAFAAIGLAGPCRVPPAFSLTVSDAAIARGSFDLAGIGLGGATALSGDTADLLALHGPVELTAAGAFYGRFDLHARFATDGTVTAAHLSLAGLANALDLAGSSAAIAGWFDDEGLCQHDQPGHLCALSAHLLTAIDEPSTTILLAATILLAVALTRLTRRT